MALNANQAAYPKAITVRDSVANMRARRGPNVPHYNFPIDRGRSFRFVADDTDTDDGIAVIATNGQGQAGRWKLIRQPIKGADLTDTAAQDVGVSGDFWRVLPSIPITQNITLTLVTANAEEGDIITITRQDVALFTVAVVNGGPGGGTLVTFPVSQKAFGDFYYDGTNWSAIRTAQML